MAVRAYNDENAFFSNTVREDAGVGAGVVANGIAQGSQAVSAEMNSILFGIMEFVRDKADKKAIIEGFGEVYNPADANQLKNVIQTKIGAEIVPRAGQPAPADFVAPIKFFTDPATCDVWCKKADGTVGKVGGGKQLTGFKTGVPIAGDFVDDIKGIYDTADGALYVLKADGTVGKVGGVAGAVATTLNDMTDADTAGANEDDHLVFQGGKWKPKKADSKIGSVAGVPAVADFIDPILTIWSESEKHFYQVDPANPAMVTKILTERDVPQSVSGIAHSNIGVVEYTPASIITFVSDFVGQGIEAVATGLKVPKKGLYKVSLKVGGFNTDTTKDSYFGCTRRDAGGGNATDFMTIDLIKTAGSGFGVSVLEMEAEDVVFCFTHPASQTNYNLNGDRQYSNLMIEMIKDLT